MTANQRADFARVKTAQQHLAGVVSEILNFARLGSGRLSYAAADVKACDAMQRAFELIEPLFGQKGTVFEGITGDLTVLARADPERVSQILVNLLSNAIKFTPAGGRSRAHCAATDDTATLAVSDPGIGIPPDKHEAILEPFFQLK